MTRPFHTAFVSAVVLVCYMVMYWSCADHVLVYVDHMLVMCWSYVDHMLVMCCSQ